MAKNSHVVAVAAPSLHEKLDRRAELQQRLDEARLDISHVDVGAKERDLYAANNEIGGYERSIESDKKSGVVNPRNQTLLNAANKRADVARAALKSEKEKFAALTDEINHLERELAQSRDGGGMGFGEVLDFQRQVKASQAEVANIASRLEEQHRILAEAQARMQPKDDHSAQREDLAVKVALGEASEKSLKDLDAEIEKQNQAVDAQVAEALPLAEAAQGAIAGLERRLGAARNALSELEAKRPAVIKMYINSVAEVEGARFVELARELLNTYLKLTSLDTLAGGNAFVSHSHGRMFIPNFRLKACQGMGCPNEPWTLFSTQYADFNKARVELINQLRAVGIQI